jgi:hypothetical protein
MGQNLTNSRRTFNASVSLSLLFLISSHSSLILIQQGFYVTPWKQTHILWKEQWTKYQYGFRCFSPSEFGWNSERAVLPILPLLRGFFVGLCDKKKSDICADLILSPHAVIFWLSYAANLKWLGFHYLSSYKHQKLAGVPLKSRLSEFRGLSNKQRSEE